jgi:hypothetical protein
MREFNRLAAVLGAGLLLGAAAATAQAWRGDAGLEVRVSSRKGGTLTGARVEMTYREGRDASGPAAVTTDAKGRAVLGGLAAGTWQLEVSHPEFMSYVAVLRLSPKAKPEVTASFLEATGESTTPIQVKLLKTSATSYPPLAAAAPKPPPAAPTPLPALPQPAAPAPEPVAPEATSAEPPPATPTMPVPTEPSEAPPEPPSVEMPEAAPTPILGAPPAEAPQADTEAPETETPETEAPETEAPETPITAPAAPEMPRQPPMAAPPDELPAATPTPEPDIQEPATSLPDMPSPPTPAPGTDAPRPSAPAPALAEPPLPEPSVPESFSPEPSLPQPALPEPALPEPPSSEPPPAQPAPPPPAPASATPHGPMATLPALPPAQPPQWRAYQERTCPECRPGEWAVTVAASVGGDGGCGEATRDVVASALATLAARPSLELAGFAGDVEGAVALLEPEEAADVQHAFGGADAEGCRILGVVLPKGSRFVGFQYEIEDGSGRRPCLPDQPCPGDMAAFAGPPRISRGASSTVIHALARATDVESTGLAANALMTVFFRGPNNAWAPER